MVMSNTDNVIEVKDVNLIIGKEHILHDISVSFEKGKIQP